MTDRNPSEPRNKSKVITDSLIMSELREEEFPRRLARIVGVTAAVAILAGVGWSGFAHVNEISVATGTLVPLEMEQTVQHLEGGIVMSIVAREGDILEAGAPMFEIDDTSTVADSEMLKRQYFTLQAQHEAQKALSEGRQPDYSFLPAEVLGEIGHVQDAYEAQWAMMQSQHREFDSQIEQARFALEAVRSELDQAEREVGHAEEEEARYSSLFAKGVVTKVRYSASARDLQRARNEVQTIANRVRAAEERLAEIEQQKRSLDAEFRSNLQLRIQEQAQALTAMANTLRKNEERKRRLVVSAPVRGIVKSIEVSGRGEVIRSGQPLATIVPLDSPLIADTRVRSDQIGHLHVGQKARIKLSSYDFTRYGWLTATIDRISPSSFQQTDQVSYYSVQMAIDDLKLSKSETAPILPGMDLTADIITGKKTVLQYLLTPLQRTLSSAFGER